MTKISLPTKANQKISKKEVPNLVDEKHLSNEFEKNPSHCLLHDGGELVFHGNKPFGNQENTDEESVRIICEECGIYVVEKEVYDDLFRDKCWAKENKNKIIFFLHKFPDSESLLTKDVIEKIINEPTPSIKERANNLLFYILRESKKSKKGFININNFYSSAVIGSDDWQYFRKILLCVESQNLIEVLKYKDSRGALQEYICSGNAQEFRISLTFEGLQSLEKFTPKSKADINGFVSFLKNEIKIHAKQRLPAESRNRDVESYAKIAKYKFNIPLALFRELWEKYTKNAERWKVYGRPKKQ